MEEEPEIVIGSPLCGPFSAAPSITPLNSDQWKAKVREGYLHLYFCLQIYWWQVRRGKYFLHEHPVNAQSWQLPAVQRLKSHPGVELYVGDQCPYHQGVLIKRNGRRCWCHALKRTGWLTNMPSLAEPLSRRCANKDLPPEA